MAHVWTDVDAAAVADPREHELDNGFVDEFDDDDEVAVNNPAVANEVPVLPDDTDYSGPDFLLWNAVSEDNQTEMQHLLQLTGAAAVDLEKGDDGHTPLVAAIINSHPGITLALVRAGANMSFMNERYGTPLNLAVARGEHAIATILLQFGADPNQRLTDRNQTALFSATRELRSDLLELLIHYGADVKLVNTRGETALHDCMSTGSDTVMVQSLVDAGADVNAKRNNGAPHPPPSRHTDHL